MITHQTRNFLVFFSIDIDTEFPPSFYSKGHTLTFSIVTEISRYSIIGQINILVYYARSELKCC